MWNDMSIPQWNWQKYLVFSRKSIKEKGMKEINRGLSHKYHYDVPNCFWPKVMLLRASKDTNGKPIFLWTISRLVESLI